MQYYSLLPAATHDVGENISLPDGKCHLLKLTDCLIHHHPDEKFGINLYPAKLHPLLAPTGTILNCYNTTPAECKQGRTHNLHTKFKSFLAGQRIPHPIQKVADQKSSQPLNEDEV